MAYKLTYELLRMRKLWNIPEISFLLFDYFITLPVSKIAFSMIIMCMYDMFGYGVHWCHGAHMQVRE